MDTNDKKLINNVKKLLSDSIDDIDPITAARLQAARKSALENASQIKSNHFFHNNRVLFASSSALATVFAVVIIAINMNSQPELNIMEDLTLLSEKETFEFYEEMDFYQWLEASETHG